MTNPALIALMILTGARVPAAELATLQKEQSRHRSGQSYRLVVNGQKTDVVLESTTEKPELDVHKTKAGVIYGTVSHAESGAYILVESIAFVRLGKQIHTLKDMQFKQRRGETLLFEPVQPGIWAVKNSARLVQSGKLIDLGPATEVNFARDGSVHGWFLAAEDGSQWEGMVSEAMENVYEQHFVWKNGSRTLTRRDLRIEGLLPRKEPPSAFHLLEDLVTADSPTAGNANISRHPSSSTVHSFVE